MSVDKSTKEFNKKWIHKREEMKKSYQGYYWGLTLVGIIIIIILILSVFHFNLI